MKELILIFVLIMCAFGQYELYTDEYHVIVNRINDGYQVDPAGTYNEGDTLNVEFGIGHGLPSYESPYTSFEWTRHIIPNDSLMWDDTTATTGWEINYPTGTYELIMIAVHLDSPELEHDTLMIAVGTNALFIYVEISDIPLSIELTFFEAAVVNGDVVLTWVTESELDNAGFNLYRKTYKGENVKLNRKLIPGQGDSAQSSDYGYIDDAALSGNTYIYTLESVSYSGAIEEEGKFSIFVPIIYGMHLAQNYPNPFNSTTTIGFSIDERSYIHLSVYDIRTRRIAKVIDKIYNAGEYKICVNADGIASGTYFYFLRAHNIRTNAVRILSKKLIVIK